MLVIVTVEVSVLRQYDKNIDVHTERAYNRIIVITIEAYDFSTRFALNSMAFVSYSSKGNEINAPIYTSISNIVFA
jgi:hypothetical protein